MNTRNINEPVKYVGGLYLSPISAENIDILEDKYGAEIVNKHDPVGFEYMIRFKDKPFGAVILKTSMTLGSSMDQFELYVIDSNGKITKKTDLSNANLNTERIGYLEEEDLMAMLRLIYRLDENGHIIKED